ncbi:hypothetical protein ACQPZX_37640 [Actinoplanes sp. CA-142083]|uniref:hypothetical protein n=1 Tax=Actinoplanes sp. CA-142083 TaxID=3239903 RepID=UPI003D93D8B3
MELLRYQRRLDADTAARDTAARAVEEDNDAIARANKAARRELQSRGNKGSLVDVTV